MNWIEAMKAMFEGKTVRCKDHDGDLTLFRAQEGGIEVRWPKDQRDWVKAYSVWPSPELEPYALVEPKPAPATIVDVAGLLLDKPAGTLVKRQSWDGSSRLCELPRTPQTLAATDWIAWDHSTNSWVSPNGTVEE